MADAPRTEATQKEAQAEPGPYAIKDFDAFALNMARALEQLGKAAGNWAEPRSKGEAAGGMEPATDMVKTLSKLAEYWLGDPSRAFAAQTKLMGGMMSLWMNAAQRMAGEKVAPIAEPDKGDKRFQDKDWQEQALFDFLKQAYLVVSRWGADLITDAEGLDERTRHKAEFYFRQVSNALSPSNFVLTNPELWRETVESGGENLVRGMTMLAEDIALGKGDLRLRQADRSSFELGRDMALTPGKVIARSELAEIIQYEPATDTVLKRPLLICPPWINKFYILDLNPKKSFIRWAVEQGHTVFVISWVNPDERHGTMAWEAYIEHGLRFALDTVEQATGEKKVNAVGYCVGGTLLAAALALMAKENDRRIKAATFLTTQVDFTHAGDLKVFADEEQIEALEKAMGARGYLDGNRMATAFNMLRPGDLIWPYMVNNYLRGKEPAAFDLLFWNADATRMAAANHSFYLRNCYLDNRLSKGEMKLAGRKISLKDVNIPIFNLATREDHIAPARSVFVGSSLFGGEVHYVLSGSGHIAGVVNPPSSGKYQYWTGDAPDGDFNHWLENASEHSGSWWPHWQTWIESQHAKRVPARKPGASTPILGEAPGEYVRVKA